MQTESAKIFITQLKDKETFTSDFLVKDKALQTDKKGKAYLTFFIADKTGELDARVWENADQIDRQIQSGDIVRVKGVVQTYNGRLQVIVHRADKLDREAVSVSDYISHSRRSPEEMYQNLLSIVDTIKNPHLRGLAHDTLTDPEIRGALLVAPAAKSIHHAYVGGLLEHILSICGWMEFAVTHYERQQIPLNRELLLIGAIFHDLAKIWELNVSDGISYTDRGKLIGHLVMAVELIEKKCSRILGFPDSLKDLCKHLVLGHHGRLEYGSPKLPVFLEAYLVAAIDDLDSRVNSIGLFLESERKATEGSWSRMHPMYERSFFLRVPKE